MPLTFVRTKWQALHEALLSLKSAISPVTGAFAFLRGLMDITPIGILVGGLIIIGLGVALILWLS